MPEKLGLVGMDWQLIFQIVNFLIIVLVLKILLFKPITNFMQERSNDIKASIEDAEEKNIEVEKLKKEYEVKIEASQEEGRQIVKDATKRAENRANEIVKEAQEEAIKIKERAESEIEMEKQKAINSIKDDMTSLAVLAASKIINKEIDDNGHDMLIKQFIDEVGDAKWSN